MNENSRITHEKHPNTIVASLGQIIKFKVKLKKIKDENSDIF